MRAISLLLGVLLLAAAAFAQAPPVINPTVLEFVVSEDHEKAKLLTGYRADWYLESVTDPVLQSDLGKPDPNQDGIVSLLIGDLIEVLDYGQYTVRVVAYGPGGETASDPSGPFSRAAVPPQPATGVTVKRP